MIETADDRLEFFEIDEGFAVECSLSGPDGFTATIPVILNAVTNPVSLYETDVEAAAVHFICRLEDLAGVDLRFVKQYTATIDGVTYQLQRVADDQDGKIPTVYLKK
jgi:hypothetical protein